jgi:hypothetical protein
MKKVSIVIGDSFFGNNRLFNLDDPIANRDNCLYSFALLKKKFAENGYDLATSDIHAPEDSEIVIYNEMPKILPDSSQKSKSFLLLFESDLIRPDNWSEKKHKAFQQVFTWHDDLIIKANYTKINFSHLIPVEISLDLSQKDKFCTLIAGNKKVSHPLELYSKRIEAIRWFEENHPEEFDLYGEGWDRYRFTGPKLIRVLNRIEFLTRWLSEPFPSYKGRVDSKFDTLKKYRFAICYENARDIPGYITEKLFDCFFSGCIPVYRGADNIANYVPKECFIDIRDFTSYEDLYKYMKSLSDEDYLRRLISIQDFLKSPKAKQFSSDSFVDTILSCVLH